MQERFRSCTVVLPSINKLMMVDFPPYLLQPPAGATQLKKPCHEREDAEYPAA